MLEKAWCMKTRQNEDVFEARITKTTKGRYMLRGVSKDGHNLCKLCSDKNATRYIAEGLAKQDF